MKLANQVPRSGSLLLILCVILPIVPQAIGGGLVTNFTQTDLESALAGGGTVSFATNGVITLTNTITITQDTILDANSNAVTISGGNAVRLFLVSTNVTFWVKGLALANGRFDGANGADGDPPAPGED